MGQPEPDRAGRAHASSVVVTVVRSGGIAGMRRQWRAAPDPQEVPRWRELLASCPWDDPGTDAAGADRFLWSIRAEDPDVGARRADVPDSRMDGPWRDLVEAVRAAAP